ncbi:Coenzyme F420 hydrogenase/dehydrogenase, beta subunit C-terminal domain [Bacteroides clarus]|uniref:Coenzyme F420 hydrogenase/dehydrogenase, beta subunit C-terminal domain n=1 Tax=Bacteroides clarus TaxID=626929 RepID=UPI00248E66AC|nr:Coenzyme F420 hydrogenase/dehydrogenase, beta subunit C-terminal domain [Bacteroides clarus]
MTNKDIYKDKKLCSGCEACVNVCVHNAITMKPDWRGFLYPSIDNLKCTNCGLCSKVCPTNLPQRNKFEFPKAAVYIDKNRDFLRQASSGGAFGVMARYVLSQGGIVYGCNMDENYEVKFICVDSLGSLYKLHGSKYVQSKVGMIYRDIRKLLKAGRMVLLCGCPCHIGALKTFLGKDYDNLITMDLICHGVPSQSYFKAYVYDLLYRKSHINTFRFRYKKDVHDENQIDNNVYIGYHNNDFYMTPFLWGKGYRSACYHCSYAGTERVGDFTIGDFWNNKNAKFPIDVSNGASLILFNNLKAKSLEVVFKENSQYVNCPTLDLAIGKDNHGQLEHPSKNDFRTDLAYLLYRIFGVSGPKVLFVLQMKIMGIAK